MMSINNRVNAPRRWWTSSLHGVNQFIDKPIVVPSKEMSLLDVDRTGPRGPKRYNVSNVTCILVPICLPKYKTFQNIDVW